MSHPAQFSPQILDVLEPIIAELGLPVHDPFAGPGVRLGALCDRVGVPFSGTEIEPEFIVDDRVYPGDSTMPLTYPGHPYVVVTSPVYPNGMADHFKANDASKRHTYRQGLAEIIGGDRPLHPNNMGQYGNRFRRSARSEETHFDIARRCIRHWPEWAVVNVKDVKASKYTVPVISIWSDMLREAGYRIERIERVNTPGQRHGANGGLREDYEGVIVARRPAP